MKEKEETKRDRERNFLQSPASRMEVGDARDRSDSGMLLGTNMFGSLVLPE